MRCSLCQEYQCEVLFVSRVPVSGVVCVKNTSVRCCLCQEYQCEVLFVSRVPV